MKILQKDITEDEIEEMMAEADTDNDGQVSFEEFKVIMQENHKIEG